MFRSLKTGFLVILPILFGLSFSLDARVVRDNLLEKLDKRHDKHRKSIKKRNRKVKRRHREHRRAVPDPGRHHDRRRRVHREHRRHRRDRFFEHRRYGRGHYYHPGHPRRPYRSYRNGYFLGGYYFYDGYWYPRDRFCHRHPSWNNRTRPLRHCHYHHRSHRHSYGWSY